MNLTFSEKSTYYSLKILSIFISFLPRFISIKFGILFGELIRLLIPVRRKVAIQNINIAFPNKSQLEKELILKKCYHHFGITFIDLFRTAQLNKNKLNQFTEFSKTDIQKLKENSGGIIVTGHIGNWEIFLSLFGLNNIPLHVVAQFQKNKGAQNYFKEMREKHNSKTILKGASSKELIAIINNNEYLGLACDQNAGKKGIMVPFFKKNTSIPKGTAIFQMKTKCPIFLCYCIADVNYNYFFVANKLDIKSLDFESDDKILEISKLISNDLEKMVKKYPEQYFWFHRKWPKKIYNNS